MGPFYGLGTVGTYFEFEEIEGRAPERTGKHLERETWPSRQYFPEITGLLPFFFGLSTTPRSLTAIIRTVIATRLLVVSK